MAFVIKVKFQNTLRRLTIGQKDGSLDLTFNDLVGKVRDMFQISPDERLVLTYVDQDNDLVTIGDDHDLHDACIIQKINPLRVHINIGDIMMQELAQDLNRCTSTMAISKPHEHSNPIRSPHFADLSTKEVKSIMEDWCRKQTSPHKVKAVVHSYRPLVQKTSEVRTLDEINQRVLQASYRREDYDDCWSSSIGKGKSQWNDQILPIHRHHHRRTRARWGNSNIGKLDARFVCDITIFDGTELAPGTHFTKIWRLRNIGLLPWPSATQLVYTGGDLLGTKQSAFIELPAEGLGCEEEMNIAVDFVAPESLGRYVSHWRLQAPSGQKFGQRVWVLIKVVSDCMHNDKSLAANTNMSYQEPEV